LGTLGGTNSFDLGINNLGQTVGQAQPSNGLWHAFLYPGAAISDLGTLGGSSSWANAINNSGQIPKIALDKQLT
jgi:probable HAF family extracellular repeat protein